LHQRQQKGERRFRSLVLIQTIELKPVSASARLEIIHLLAQLVRAEEPMKRSQRLLQPRLAAGREVGFQTSGNAGLRFEGLLVKFGPLPAFWEKSFATDGREVSVFGRLLLHQPSKRL